MQLKTRLVELFVI